MKKWLEYLIYSILLALLVFVGQSLRDPLAFGYDGSLLFLHFLINMAMGLVLGLDFLFVQFKKEGSWRINAPKIVLMVTPSLILSLTFFIFFGPSRLLVPTSMLFRLLRLDFTRIFQLIFGYSLITSFYKQDTRSDKKEIY